jgi:amino acid adenylation domain-containing protein
VSWPGGALSYAELNRRANRLAHHLRRLGVGPEVRVALALGRSARMVEAVLAVLKAGGAYVPLDPAYPRQRLDFMLRDSGAALLLSERALSATLPRFNPVLWLDDDIVAPDHDPPSAVHPHNLAYVIYTSGSTGTPKGVAIAHRGLHNLVEAQRKVFHVAARDRVLQLASISFDASIFEICLAFGAGATLCLGTADVLVPRESLAEFLCDQKITTVTIPPSLLAGLTVERHSGLNKIIAAGEASAPELIRRWSDDRNFFNAYGPTETTVWATIAAGFSPGRRASIGRPIQNVRAYVLDPQLEPVPPSVPAELYLEGAGLARGYLGRPDLTADRFIPNPFSTMPGDRLYRTGDRACYRPDGSLEFIDRVDHQLKLRGVRIELEEIEAALMLHPSVVGAAATVWEEADHKLLAAYVVPKGDRSPSAAELRRFLADRLPDASIPTRFATLTFLPRTVTGKLDRKLLPAIDAGYREHWPMQRPETATETLLLAIWRDVLNIEDLSVDDDFFELGGHSLLATKVVARIQHAFGKELPLRRLFEAPTVAELARTLVDESFESESKAPPIVTIGREAYRLRRSDAERMCASDV